MVRKTVNKTENTWGALPEQERFTKVTDEIKNVVYDCIGEEVNENEPLMEAGIDSLTAIELKTKLQQSFYIKMSATILFDYPTIVEMARFISSQFTSNEPFVNDPEYSFEYHGTVEKCFNFSVTRKNIGMIVFPGILNVTKLDVNKDIQIVKDNTKTAGILSNKPVIITYFNFLDPKKINSKMRKMLTHEIVKDGGILFYLDKESGDISFSKHQL